MAPYLPTNSGPSSEYVQFLPESPLVIRDEVLIDGYTAPGYNVLDPEQVPIIQLNGSQQVGGNALHLAGGARDSTTFIRAVGSYPPVDLRGDSPTLNDPGDVDTGANRLQNFPGFDPEKTWYDVGSGDVVVQYIVDPNTTEAAYPLTIDFYLQSEPNGDVGQYLGSDIYGAAYAGSEREFSFDPIGWSGGTSGFLVATAIDQQGNSSKLSTQVVSVSEPGLSIFAPIGALFLAMGVHRRRTS